MTVEVSKVCIDNKLQKHVMYSTFVYNITENATMKEIKKE